MGGFVSATKAHDSAAMWNGYWAGTPGNGVSPSCTIVLVPRSAGRHLGMRNDRTLRAVLLLPSLVLGSL